MAIRQRSWKWKGKQRSAWVVDYLDLKGKRRLKTLRTKREAQDFAATTHVDLKHGTHVADRDSITVGQASDLWLATCEDNDLERSSIARNRQHVELHIKPRIGNTKLNKLTVPAVRQFGDRLRSEGLSAALGRMVMVSLGSMLADAQERGLAMSNPVRELKRRRRGKRGAEAIEARKKPLEVGVDIPLPSEIKAILAAVGALDLEKSLEVGSGGNVVNFPSDPARRRAVATAATKARRRALVATAGLAGLRGSELRGLRWSDVDFAKSTITVWQRADAWGVIGETKSRAGYRTIPVPSLVINALKEWQRVCPLHDTGKKGTDRKPIKGLYLVFPSGAGNVETHQNIVRRHWHPLQIAAGVSVPVLNENGKPVPLLDDKGEPMLDDSGRPVMQTKAKYSGLHALRHFYASWCAARVQDGGLGLPLKTVQARMGHATLAMTADRYGHLFPATDDAEVLAAGERALMGA